MRRIGDVAIKLGETGSESIAVLTGNGGDVLQYRFSSLAAGGASAGAGSVGGVVEASRSCAINSLREASFSSTSARAA